METEIVKKRNELEELEFKRNEFIKNNYDDLMDSGVEVHDFK